MFFIRYSCFHNRQSHPAEVGKHSFMAKISVRPLFKRNAMIFYFDWWICFNVLFRKDTRMLKVLLRSINKKTAGKTNGFLIRERNTITNC